MFLGDFWSLHSINPRDGGMWWAAACIAALHKTRAVWHVFQAELPGVGSPALQGTAEERRQLALTHTLPSSWCMPCSAASSLTPCSTHLGCCPAQHMQQCGMSVKSGRLGLGCRAPGSLSRCQHCMVLPSGDGSMLSQTRCHHPACDTCSSVAWMSS